MQTTAIWSTTFCNPHEIEKHHNPVISMVAVNDGHGAEVDCGVNDSGR